MLTTFLSTGMLAPISMMTATTAHATELKIPSMTVAQYNAMNMDDLYDKATEGHTDAQFHLARRLQKGIGVAKDSTAAIEWYKLAAKQGATPAQLNLGYIYTRGDGVPADEEQARYWLEQAVIGGDNRASFILAMLDEQQHKLVDAYKWYDLATRDSMLSDPIKNKARGKIGQLAMNLSSQDINNARSLANSWISNH